MNQTSHNWVNSCRVWTHEKNSRDTVHWLGTIIQSVFCVQSGASIRLTFWKCSSESWCLKTFVSPFLPAWLTTPGSPRMILCKVVGQLSPYKQYWLTQPGSLNFSHLLESWERRLNQQATNAFQWRHYSFALIHANFNGQTKKIS